MVPKRRQVLQSVLRRDYKGPRAGYGEVEVLKAMLAIGNSPVALGRNRLSQLIGLGQGEVKTLISRLKDNGLITVEAHGCEFTERGEEEFDSISKVIRFSSEVNAQGLGVGKFTWAVVLSQRSVKIRRGIEQRDAAVIAGASGAVTVVYSSGKFMIPDGVNGTSKWADCEAFGSNEPWTTIRAKAKLIEGDVVIICGGDALSLAQDGALSSALTVL